MGKILDAIHAEENPNFSLCDDNNRMVCLFILSSEKHKLYVEDSDYIRSIDFKKKQVEDIIEKLIFLKNLMG